MKRDDVTNFDAAATEAGETGLLAQRVRGMKRWLAKRLETHRRRVTALGVHRRSRH